MQRFIASVLGFVLVGGMQVRVRADERVDITATDGAQLIGDLAGTSGPGVVLTHGEHRDRQAWQVTVSTIAARGFRTLCVDLRGHGESAGSADLAKSDQDVEGAYRYLLGRKIRPVFLVGTGIGGTASVIVATRVPVAGVAVLGLRPTDPVLDARAALPNLHTPTLFLTNESDQEAKTLATLDRSSRIVKVPDPNVLSSHEVLRALEQFLSDPTGAISIEAR